jgi:protoporphyrinogen oxidase
MEVPDHAQCDPQKIRIIHVGAGAAGMLCAFKARKSLTNYELICYEKNESPGGKHKSKFFNIYVFSWY